MTFSPDILNAHLDNLIQDQNLDAALDFIRDLTLAVIEDPASTGLVFQSPLLDDMCQRIGAHSLTRVVTSDPTAESVRPAVDVLILATELRDVGGHSRVIEDIIAARPNLHHLVLMTNFYMRTPDFATKRYLDLGADVQICPHGSSHVTLAWVQRHLHNHRAAEVLVFNHHADAACIAAIQPGLNRDVIFHHHADHQLCLGASLKWTRHIDYADDFLYRCKRQGLDPELLPLSAPDHSPRAWHSDSFMATGTVTTCTSGTENKFIGYGATRYWEMVPRILEATGGRHIHIGPLSEDMLVRIREGLRSRGLEQKRFQHHSWVANLWCALVEMQVDIYIGSFPIGGGRATIEALGAGIPVITYRNELLPILGAAGLGPEETWVWATIHELEKILHNVDRTELSRRSVTARQHYLTRHSEELFCSIVRGERQLKPIQNAAVLTDDLSAYFARAVIRSESQNPVLERFQSIATSRRYAAIVHLYHDDLFDEIASRLDNLPNDTDLFFSVRRERLGAVTDIVRMRFPRARIFAFENRGRDIQPFLQILHDIVGTGYHAICKVHTKKSPHHGTRGELWRTELLTSLLGDRITVERCLKKIQSGAGIVGPFGHILSCKQFIGDNASKFSQLIDRIGTSKEIAEHAQFAAGSMFWFTPQALRPLINLGLRPKDFEVESGQLDGTLAHAVERAIGVSCAMVGLRIEDSADAHMSWIQAGKLDITDSILKRLTHRQEGNLIQVVISGNESDLLARTQESLHEQETAPMAVLHHTLGAPLSTILTDTVTNWTLLLCPGDTLDSAALFVLQHSVAHEDLAQAVIAYFDTDEFDDADCLHAPNLKPEYNLDLLLSYPYLGRTIMVRTAWLKSQVNGATACDLVLAHRLALSAAREFGSAGFVRVPMLLAHLTPSEPHTFALTSDAWQALAGNLRSHLEVSHPGSHLIEGPSPGTFHAIFPLEKAPLVSIIIPTRDQLAFLSRCIESLLEKTNYPSFEILIVNNDSHTHEAKEYLRALAELDQSKIRVLSAPGQFNFSRMNNLAVGQTKGEFILLLNNDTAALQPDWLSHMMRHALRKDVGIVGARLVYPDGKLQHAGVVMGLRGPADHPSLGIDATEPGYLFRNQVTQNFSAVTAACMLVSKALYEEVGGLDEDTFGVSYNDVDFCLRVGKTGRRIVWTPLATLLHEGSASQRAQVEGMSQGQKLQRFSKEQAAMYERWPEVIANDPAYNPNLSLVEKGYEIETNPLLRFNKLQCLTAHRVVAFAADDAGCGHYRVLQPMQAMLDKGLCTGGASPEMFGPNLVLRSGADRLIFQRPSTDDNLNLLNALLPLKGIKKIYELDDNIARVPIKSAHKSQIASDIQSRISKAIGLCDRLVVSTEPLAQELRGKNDDIRVVMNRLPPAMWGTEPPVRPVSQRKPGAKPKVAWAGGAGHQGDLESIFDVVKDLADKVDWVFFGMLPEAFKPYVSEFYQGVPTQDYPKRMLQLSGSWDLAIAPLERNAFNDCKSNLKLLEYGWCGVPVVCSDITPYQGNLPCKLVKNRYLDWRNTILAMVSDPVHCHSEGLRLQSEVKNDWMLDGANLQSWYAAWTD